jgi:hypothetical protein
MKCQRRIGIGPQSRGLTPQSFQQWIYASLSPLQFVGRYVVFHPIRVTSARLHNNVQHRRIQWHGGRHAEPGGRLTYYYIRLDYLSIDANRNAERNIVPPAHYTLL